MADLFGLSVSAMMGDQALPWDPRRSENLTVLQNHSVQWEKIWVEAQKSW